MRGFFICIALLVVGAILAPASHGAEQPELRQIFEQILRDPTNTNLNFRYARLAIEKGELRKALAAYERILAKDPDNAEATVGLANIKRLLEPDRTTAVAIFGTQYESNPSHFNFNSSKIDDLVLFGRFQVTDERRIGRTRWRTEGDLFVNWHKEFRSLDFGNVGFRTGPILDISKDWRVRPAIGGAFAWLDGERFFNEASLALEFESDTSGPLKSVNVGGAYDFLGRKFSARDAYQITVNPRLIFDKVGTKSGLLVLNPFYRFNGVTGSGAIGTGPSGDPFPLRFHQFGMRADYFLPLSRKFTVGVNFTIDHKRFTRIVTFGTKQRRDTFLSPGVQLVLVAPVLRNNDVILSYRFEHNISNDRFERYDNHIVGVRLLWRF